MNRFQSHLNVAAVCLAAILAGPAHGQPEGAGRVDVRPVPGVPEAPVELASPAATPQLLFYQGRLTELSGQPRTGTVTLTFGLYVNPQTNTPLWTESHSPVPLIDGIFSVLLGSVTPFPPGAWANPDRYLGVAVDGAAELQPRLRIAAVPFAIEADRLNGKRSADFDPSGAAAIAAAGLSSQLKGSDNNPPNVGSNQVHWNNLYGMPAGIADGVDSVGAGVVDHGALEGLADDDHPQYVLGAALQVSDGTPPNLGSNRVHWNNLGGVPGPLADNVLPGSWIQSGVIDSTHVAEGGINESNLAPGSLSGSRIVPGSIGPDQIADESLTGADIKNGTVTGDEIQNGTITGADIQDGSISSSDIANGTILSVDLAPGTISSDIFPDGSIDGAKLADQAVTASKIALNSIEGDMMMPESVGPRELAFDALSGENVLDGSLTAADLGDAPGLAFKNRPGFIDSINNEFGEPVDSVTIVVPAPGYILATGASQLILLHDVGTATEVSLALSTIEGSMPDSTLSTIFLPGSYASDLYQFPMTIQNVFPAPSAGPVTIFLNVRKGDQPRDPSVHDARIQAVYVPRLY